jgi:hypothetical protein
MAASMTADMDNTDKLIRFKEDCIDLAVLSMSAVIEAAIN